MGGRVKKNTFTPSWLEEVVLLQQNAKWLNCEAWKLIFCHLNIESTCNYHHFKLLMSFVGSKTKILHPPLYGLGVYVTKPRKYAMVVLWLQQIGKGYTLLYLT